MQIADQRNAAPADVLHLCEMQLDELAARHAIATLHVVLPSRAA
jgi:hypothetical protein